MTKSLSIAIALASSALLAACDRGPPAPDKTIQQLMAQDVQPTADVYWKSVQFISDETGDHDIFPRTDEEWASVKAAATRLGEYGGRFTTAPTRSSLGDAVSPSRRGNGPRATAPRTGHNGPPIPFSS